MDPEVAKAFHASTAVSLQHGAGANMLKVGSKRRRPPAEVKAEREAKATKEAQMMEKLAELKQFEQQLAQQKQELEAGREATAVVNGLLESGHLKQRKDGSWFLPSEQGSKKQ